MSNDTKTLQRALDVLCPMHLVLNATGHVVHAGPTAQKIFAETGVLGQRFFEIFELRRPRIEASLAALRKMGGQRLHFMMRTPGRTEMKGVLVPLPESGVLGPKGGVIVNLSFGISVMDAVRNYSLTNSDFAATDLAVEMLYLVEAKSAAMEESRKLNLRLQGAKAAAEEQAFTDTLTGLHNRRALEPMLNRLIETGDDFVLMHLDLDHFKAVNDTMGHAAGDHVLKHVATVLRRETRQKDAIIRVGGDEFVLIFAPHMPDRDLQTITDRLIRRLEEPIAFNGEACQISASIGTTRSQEYDFPHMDQLMDDADVALYAAKEAGRGRHVAYDPSLRDAASVSKGTTPLSA